MGDYETTAEWNESLYYERLGVDMQQAEFEAEGNRSYARLERVKALIAEGKLDEATALCDHGHVGKLTGSCSEDDPRYGEQGYRCYECGGVVDEIGGRRLHVA